MTIFKRGNEIKFIYFYEKTKSQKSLLGII